MGAVSLKQTSLSGGILSPQLRGHSDQEKYATGVQDAVNFIVTREGTLENRAGTLYVDGQIWNAPRRLVPFTISQGLAYVLWFVGGGGSQAAYFLVYHNELPVDLSSATYAPDAWNNANAYAYGNVVANAGVFYYALQAVPVSTAIGNTAYWYPMAGTTLQIPFPAGGITATILQSALATMQYTQLNDLLVLASQKFQPQVITYTLDTTVPTPNTKLPQFTIASFAPSVPTAAPTITAILPNPSNYGPPFPHAPTALMVSGGTGAATYSYIVTTSGSSTQSAGSVVSALIGQPTGGSPVTLSWTAPAGGGIVGYNIYRASSATSGWQLLASPAGVGTSYTDNGSVTPLPQTLAPNATTPGALLYSYVITSVDQVTGIESLPSAVKSIESPNPGGPGQPIIVFFTGVAGAASYNVYRSVSLGGGSAPVFGYIGNAQAGSNSFGDIVTAAGTAIQPPTQIVDPAVPAGSLALFSTANNYPAVVGTYQQRLLFANTINQPQTFWGSRTGAWYVWTQSTPQQADDAGQWTLAGRTIQQINALVDIGALVIHTISGEYIAKGDQSGTLTPSAAGIVQQGYAGSQLLQPVVIGNTDLFCQARGSIIRDLQFTIQSYNYSGKDCTIFAPDLFAGETVTAMAWQQVPHSIVWVVLNSGALLSFTYIKEHNIWSWCRHNTSGGYFEDVCVVPEAGEDGVYVTVVRVFGGFTYRYLERIANRAFTDVNAAIFVDSCQVYDGRNASIDTMTLTGSGWAPTASLTLTLSNGTNPRAFVSGDVGNAIILQQVTTAVTYDTNNNAIPVGTVIDSVTLKILAYTSATVVTVQPGKTVPAWAQATPLNTWGKAVHTFTIGNLPSSPVTGLGDGNVIPAGTTNGSGVFTTANNQNYLRVVLGLPIVARLQTLSIESVQGETLMNKNKRVSEVTIYFYASRGGKMGQSFNALFPWVQRGLVSVPAVPWEPWNQSVYLYTGPAIVPIQGTWEIYGQMCLEQTDPLPVGISAIVVTAEVGN